MTEPTKDATLPVGTLWEIPNPGKDVVTLHRPDGQRYALVSILGKVVEHVLDVAGTYTAEAGGKTHTVTAV